ncbi:unnamed protein product [Durusdinium trenchii]|uniref:CMP/dCMP-type deaminase domain-containing protein n=1 Tax=Durusdinium trenchii TaxID=1381693 RepID=A0ABP0PK90_9DINO
MAFNHPGYTEWLAAETKLDAMPPLKRPAASTPSSKRRTKTSTSLTLSIEDFHQLGDFAEAGLEAVRLALERADKALSDGRVPISGAAVEMKKTGALHVVAVGQNGRIPPLPSEETGYPTDHGETAAIREIEDVSKVDWSQVVFATSLSPCVMCGAALTWLWSLGLRRIVVAESLNFSGTADMLAKLDGMTVVRLSSVKAQSMMMKFSTKYPWDWAADIGEIPPSDLKFSQSLEERSESLRVLMAKMQSLMTPKGHVHCIAAVVSAKGIHASAEDERSQSGGNETRSAVMLAMGQAGSQVNLRECVLVFMAPGTVETNLDDFGSVSIGACKLFRPAKVVVTAPPVDELRASLEGAGIPVLVADT